MPKHSKNFPFPFGARPTYRCELLGVRRCTEGTLCMFFYCYYEMYWIGTSIKPKTFYRAHWRNHGEKLTDTKLRNRFFLPSNPDFVRAPWKINGFCTWKSPLWNGKSSAKASFLGSNLLIFRGVSRCDACIALKVEWRSAATPACYQKVCFHTKNLQEIYRFISLKGTWLGKISRKVEFIGDTVDTPPMESETGFAVVNWQSPWPRRVKKKSLSPCSGLPLIPSALTTFATQNINFCVADPDDWTHIS